MKNIMYWYLKVLNQYADFKGRARRKEFWMFSLISLLIAVVLGCIDIMAGTHDADFSYGLFSSLYSLAVLIPNLSVGVRRLHDIGKSGWLMLIIFIPIVGAILLLILFLIEGNAHDNKYGVNPKQ